MKRQWRPGRIIWAVMLVGIAALMISFWPKQPRWRIAAEEVLGFDDKRQALLTIKDKNSQTNLLLSSEISFWDLESGQRKFSLTCETKKRIRFTPDRGRLLSPNGAYMANWGSSFSYLIELVQLVNGKTIHEFQMKDDQHGFLDTIGFSQDSRFLAASTFYHAWVWDLQTGKLANYLDLAPGELFINGVFCTRPKAITFSPDNNYLAISSAVDNVIVFDLKSNRKIGRSDERALPQFLSDGNTLCILGFDNVYATTNPTHNLYTIERESLKKWSDPISRHWEKDHLVVISSEEFATAKSVISLEWAYPEWFPEMAKETLTNLLGINQNKWEISFWDMLTGELKNRFHIHPIEKDYSRWPDMAALAGPRFKSFRSPFNQLIAIQDEEEVSLWDIPPRRPLVCYLIALVLAGLALLLAWPRHYQHYKLRANEPIYKGDLRESP